jgi:hypothetical protein
MKMISCFWLAVLVVLLPACKAPDDARFTSLRGSVEVLARTQAALLEWEKDALAYQVSKRGNRPEHLALITRADRACRAALSVLNQVDSLQPAFTAVADPGANAARQPD